MSNSAGKRRRLNTRKRATVFDTLKSKVARLKELATVSLRKLSKVAALAEREGYENLYSNA